MNHRPLHAFTSLKEILRPRYLKWVYFRLFPEARPAYFRECWNYPDADVAGWAQRRSGDGEDPDVLWLPMTDWHTRIQRTQHLARALAAAGQRNFYLNPHLGREFPHPYGVQRSVRHLEIEPGIIETHVHLKREPVFHQRRLEGDEIQAVTQALAALVEAAGSRRLTQVLSFPLWLETARELRARFGAPIVYDCHDLLSGFPLVARALVEAEEEVFEAADLVVFSARRLWDVHVGKRPELAERAVLVRNGVEESWVGEAGDPAKAGEVVVGYAGALDYWFDAEALREAARRHPAWTFVLLGRVENERLRQLLGVVRNVRFGGEVPHRELRGQLEEFTVGVIPFLRNELTLGANPIKLYEYFSRGLPVVSADLPEVAAYGDLVYLYRGPQEFVAQLERAVAEADPQKRQRRRAVAAQETWTKRAGLLREAFRALLTARPSGR